jgi:hypothetical protein
MSILRTFVNFSDEKPSVHPRRALVRRLWYLRGQNAARCFQQAGLRPDLALGEAGIIAFCDFHPAAVLRKT